MNDDGSCCAKSARRDVAYDWDTSRNLTSISSPTFTSHVLYPAFELGISVKARGKKVINYDKAWGNEQSGL